MRLNEIIKLSRPDTSKGEAFIELLYNTYPTDPWRGMFLIVDNKGLLKVSADKWLGADVLIDELGALERGGGNLALTQLCKLADEHKIKLSLNAHPFENNRGKLFSLEGLVNWYKKFYFVVKGDWGDDYEGLDSVEMIRNPR